MEMDDQDGKKEVPLIVYFSSVSENTKRFVDKLELESFRLPLKTKDNANVQMDKDFILICPSYGAGTAKDGIPKQILMFLGNKVNRDHCLAVIGGGNRNFGEYYQFGSYTVSRYLGVPMIHDFEISGTKKDVDRVEELVQNYANSGNWLGED